MTAQNAQVMLDNLIEQFDLAGLKFHVFITAIYSMGGSKSTTVSQLP